MAYRDPPLSSLPFAGLPPELWLHIASFTSAPPGPIIFTFTTPAPNLAALVRQPSLLRTSHFFRDNLLSEFYAQLIIMVIGDTELPRSLEGRTGAMPPNLQRFLTAVGVEHREKLGGCYMSHFREVPVRGGWIDGSVIKYDRIERPGWDIFGPWGQDVDVGGFVFRPWTVKVRFEKWGIVLRDSKDRAESAETETERVTMADGGQETGERCG